ncbi:sensor histidine kinase [Planctomicrobium sp. SH664]|uniref:sensor histidine kinase n=1 Tax=Planctomicrobium sp. SH664 TaxID=3448125 RepID=UPI003F5C1FA3
MDPSNPPTVSDRFERQYNEIAALAGGLAHEVRNPLSTIRLNLELLFEELESVEHPAVHRIQRKLKTIQKECGHLDEVLEAFLQFSRAGELTLEQVDLAEVLRSFLEFYKAEAEQHRIDVRAHLSADLPEVRIDRRLFRQVLTNLLLNAQQSMPHGGVVELQAFTRGERVVLEIIDTGCGIAPKALEKIFDVFFSTKPSGSGLGLPTVRKIIEAHGGTIQCESEPGRGTRFTLSLPAGQTSET